MKKLRWFDLISINLFWFGLNVRNNAVGAVFMPFLVDSFVRPEIKNTALGEMRTASLIIAMLIQPLAGLLSDRSTSRFGRRRPFIFLGTVLDLIFLTAIGMAGSYWVLLGAVLIFQFPNNISHGALQGLIPDLVPEDQRGRASGVKALMELLPLVVIAVVISKLVEAGQIGLAFVVTGGALLVTMLLTMWLVKEEPLLEKPTEPLGPSMVRVLGMLAGILTGGVAGLLAGALVGGLIYLIALTFLGVPTAQAVGVSLGGLVAMVVAVWVGVWSGGLITIGKEARQKSSFIWWVVNRLLFLAAITSIQAYTPYFLMYAFKIDRNAAAGMNGSLILVVAGFTVICALAGGWLADRFGRKRLTGISGIIAAVGAFLLLAAIWYPSLGLLYGVGALLGVATGLFTAINWALGTDLIPPSEAGRYLGISNLAGAGAGMIGTGIGGPVADFVNGIMPGLGYFVLFFCYAVLFALSAVSLRWVKSPRG